MLRNLWTRANAPVKVPAKSGAERRAEDMAAAAIAATDGDYDRAQAIWTGYAHAGDAAAQTEIAKCFLNGHGVERDTALAEKWLSLAAKAGYPAAQRLLGAFYFNGEIWQARVCDCRRVVRACGQERRS